MATYRCSGCGAEVARGAAICPSCHGHLAGVRCLHCGYSGSDREFRDDRCPMCGTRRAPHAEPHFRCPKCATPLPDIRRPKNRRQLLWGGWTCPGCGVELDRSRRVIQAAGAPAPAAAPAAGEYSADGYWRWDGAAWRLVSADRRWWWDGSGSQPLVTSPGAERGTEDRGTLPG